MSETMEKLLSLADEFVLKAESSFEKVAEKKSDADPKAKVRNRGKVVFPAESSSVKDNKDHFPINDADQARNALSRAGQYSSVPPWYKGSLESLKSAISRAVHHHYPSIGKEKKSSVTMDNLFKFAESWKPEKPEIYRLYDQLKIARKIGDEDAQKDLQSRIDEWLDAHPHFKYRP